jgi:hypothetical protein
MVYTFDIHSRWDATHLNKPIWIIQMFAFCPEWEYTYHLQGGMPPIRIKRVSAVYPEWNSPLGEYISCLESATLLEHKTRACMNAVAPNGATGRRWPVTRQIFQTLTTAYLCNIYNQSTVPFQNQSNTQLALGVRRGLVNIVWRELRFLHMKRGVILW